MRRFIAITFTQHATTRMQQRRVLRTDVEAVLEDGECAYDEENGTWNFEGPSEFGRAIRVIVIDLDGEARVITVMRLRKAL